METDDGRDGMPGLLNHLDEPVQFPDPEQGDVPDAYEEQEDVPYEEERARRQSRLARGRKRSQSSQGECLEDRVLEPTAKDNMLQDYQTLVRKIDETDLSPLYGSDLVNGMHAVLWKLNIRTVPPALTSYLKSREKERTRLAEITKEIRKTIRGEDGETGLNDLLAQAYARRNAAWENLSGTYKCIDDREEEIIDLQRDIKKLQERGERENVDYSHQIGEAETKIFTYQRELPELELEADEAAAEFKTAKKRINKYGNQRKDYHDLLIHGLEKIDGLDLEIDDLRRDLKRIRAAGNIYEVQDIMQKVAKSTKSLQDMNSFTQERLRNTVRQYDEESRNSSPQEPDSIERNELSMDKRSYHRQLLDDAPAHLYRPRVAMPK